MKKLFEIPELFTLDGTSFTGDLSVLDGYTLPGSCMMGCDPGCSGGGCYPGSAFPDD